MNCIFLTVSNFSYAHILLYWYLRCRICQSCQECLMKKLLLECLLWASEFLIAFGMRLWENQPSMYKLFRQYNDNSEFFLVFVKQSWYWQLLQIICKALIDALCSRQLGVQWLRCCATNRKVAGSIPDGVIGIFHSHNPSDRTTALGSTQPLTKVSTRIISWG